MDEPAYFPPGAPRTLPALCLTALASHAKPDAINYKEGGEWRRVSGAQFVARVRAAARGLASLGVRRGDRVALLSENRPEWSVADLATLSLGAVNVPVYPTQAVEQVRHILSDSRSRVLLVSNRRVFRHAREGVEGAGVVERIVFFDADSAAEVEGATTLAELERAGAALDADAPHVFNESVAALAPDDLATII